MATPGRTPAVDIPPWQKWHGPRESFSYGPAPASQGTVHLDASGQEQASHAGYAPSAGIHIGAHLAPDYAFQNVGTAAFAGSVDAPNTTMFNVRPNADDFDALKMPPPQDALTPAFQPSNAGVPVQKYAPYGATPYGSIMPNARMPNTQSGTDGYNTSHWQSIPAGHMPNNGPFHASEPVQNYASRDGGGAGFANPNGAPNVHVPNAQPVANAGGLPIQQPAPAPSVPHAGQTYGNPPAPGHTSRMQEAADSAGPSVDVPMNGNQPAANGQRSPPPRFCSEANARRRRDYPVDWDEDHPAWDYDEPYLFPFDLLGMINQLQYRVCVLEANAQLRNMDENFDEGGEWCPNDGPSQQHDRAPVVQYQPWLNQQVMVDRSILQDPELSQTERTPHAGGEEHQRRLGESGAIGWAVLGFGGLPVVLIGWLLYAVLGMRADMRGFCEAMEQVEIGEMWEG